MVVGYQRTPARGRTPSEFRVAAILSSAIPRFRSSLIRAITSPSPGRTPYRLRPSQRPRRARMRCLAPRSLATNKVFSPRQLTAVRQYAAVIASCRVTLTRWPDQLSIERKNELMSAATLLSSIPRAISIADGESLTVQQKRRFAETQMRASGHVHSALGEARREQDRNGDVTNGHQ